MTDTGRETARLTVDVVVFGINDGELYVLMIRRAYEPFAGALALPGGHVDPGEDIELAARRELTEETNLDLGGRTLKPVGVYAEPGRDPRGRYVTFAYTVVLPKRPAVTAGDDAADVEWVFVNEVLDPAAKVAFDHARIVRDARALIVAAGYDVGS